ARSQSSQGDRIGTVIDISKRDRVRAAKVEKDAECADTHPARNAGIAGAINVSRPDNDIRDAELLAILGDHFVLFDLGETISVALQLRSRLHRARLIEQAGS